MAEREGRDVTDVIVLKRQFTERARQIHGDRGDLVVRQVQGFQGSKVEGTNRRITSQEISTRRLFFLSFAVFKKKKSYKGRSVSNTKFAEMFCNNAHFRLRLYSYWTPAWCCWGSRDCRMEG